MSGPGSVILTGFLVALWAICQSRTRNGCRAAWTLPVMVGITIPLGFVIGGVSGILSAFATAVVVTLVYEFCHCMYHLNYTPKAAWLRRGKVLHLAHHYRNETGNFGIISFLPDRLFGTLYSEAAARPQSKTVFNLGYD